jgi:hypothetical protein
LHAIHVITPIHSIKSNIYADFQNTLPSGSQALSDNRKITPVKESLPAQKAWAQAIGIQTQTITSTVYVPMADMSVNVKTNGGALAIVFTGLIQLNTAGSFTNTTIFVDGVQLSGNFNFMTQAASGAPNVEVSINTIVPLSAGFHKIDIYWRVPGGQSVSVISDTNSNRSLTVREL